MPDRQDTDPLAAYALDMAAPPVLAIFRALRRNGGSWLEATVLTCGQVVISGILSDGNDAQ
jgi:hypothetical protein